jgi:GNAT superfamily N-acetyltransferase
MFICELFDQLPNLINKTADVDGILVSINTNATNASVYATSNGRRLGYAEFDRDGNTLVPYDLAVDDKYRGQGIAAVMYDYVKNLGFTIRASTEQTDAGKYFWKKNRGEERVWEDNTNEVTLVPSVAKSKREHLDVMPNDGRPIPKGEESEHLGNLVAEMGNGYQLWSWTDRGTVTYFVFDTNTRTSQLGTTGRPYTTHRNSFVVQGVYSGPKNRYRAADLYAFLILNRGLTLVSDNKQSEGGYRVWQELEQRYSRKINIHGFDTKTNEPVNVTTRDEPDTHVARADVKKAGPLMKKELGSISRDLRFVASAK